MTEFEKREHDDDAEVPLWPTGSESKPVLTWPSFLNFWKNNYPSITVRPKGADTCADCLKLLYSLKGSSSSPAGVQIEGEEAVEEAVENAIADTDKRKQEAERHVKAYKTQRDFANWCIQESRMDIRRNVSFKKRRHCLTIDMGQNLALPNFEGEQPGDTYYLSPITVCLFGSVDNSRAYNRNADRCIGEDHMNAYIWHEQDGKRGMNNIASCLYKDYQRRGYFEGGKHEDSLTVIADNCAGQNKNEAVIRFHLWLVEAGVFPTVRVVFLIKGHTKNAADRLFNLLKLDYHNRNIYTMAEMITVLDKNDHVTVSQLGPNDFYDFQGTLNKYYRSLESSQTTRTHVFEILSTAPTVLRKQDIATATVRTDNLLPTKRNKIAIFRPPPTKESL